MVGTEDFSKTDEVSADRIGLALVTTCRLAFINVDAGFDVWMEQTMLNSDGGQKIRDG
jgi:hypothetical protein